MRNYAQIGTIFALLQLSQHIVNSNDGSTSNEINLNVSCAQETAQERFCSISGISATLDTPLVINNVSAPRLEQLILRNSIIKILPNEIFRLAAQLNTLIMHNCGIYRINMEDFRSANNLKALVLQKNRISKLTDRLFTLLVNLNKLELGFNIIHTIHKDAFLNLIQLNYLGLQGNGIRTIMDEAFRPLINLEHIDLSGNEIEKLDDVTFQYNEKLKTVLLSGNRFTVFEPNTLAHLQQLHLVDLSNAAVDELQIQSTNSLLLQGSGAKRLFINKSIIRLQASNNELQITIGDKSTVIELNLHDNLLHSIDLLYGMFNLQRLDLSKNNIESLMFDNQGTRLELPQLTHLNLASNQLQTLSADNFLLMPHLLQLDISFNHLLRLGAETFEPLINLEKLYMEGNRLHDFDYELFMRNHAQLKELGLGDNEWDFHFKRKMFTYLSDRGIHLPARFVKHAELDANQAPKTLSQQLPNGEPILLPSSSPTSSLSSLAQVQRVGVTGIHPYWTTRDVLALITLLAVFIILLLQIYRMLQEDRCFTRCWARARASLNDTATGSTTQQRARRLNEEDSELSSSE